MGRTFLVVSMFQPADTKQVFREELIPARNDQRPSTFDDKLEYEVLEVLRGEPLHLLDRNAPSPLEVVRTIDEMVQIEIRGDRIELGLGVQRGRHFVPGRRGCFLKPSRTDRVRFSPASRKPLARVETVESYSGSATS